MGGPDARRSEDVPWATTSQGPAARERRPARPGGLEAQGGGGGDQRRRSDPEVAVGGGGHDRVGPAPEPEASRSSPWEAESMTVSDLLTSQKRWGSTRCRKFLQCVLIPENKTIGSMTERQRRALAGMLSEGDASCRTEDVRVERSEALQPMLAGVA